MHVYYLKKKNKNLVKEGSYEKDDIKPEIPVHSIIGGKIEFALNYWYLSNKAVKNFSLQQFSTGLPRCRC